jgi:DNA/RNA-binding domain of Phe-tRNA-synthetase-like protein
MDQYLSGVIMRFIIEPTVFSYFPGIKIVTAIARNIPKDVDTAGIHALLQTAWQSAAQEVTTYGNPQSHPYIKPWGESMQKVGAPRKHFPCAIESLARRAAKGGEPFHIHPTVDFYNAVSLQFLAPAGGFDIDQMQNDFILRFSQKSDTFTALDSDEAIPVPPGEVSYTDGNIVVTRHFVWRQAKHTILTPDSRNILFISEVLGELPEDYAIKVADAFKTGLFTYFGVNAQITILDEQHPILEGLR